MCEVCRYSKMDAVRDAVATARPEQVLRLLDDIRNSGPKNARETE